MRLVIVSGRSGSGKSTALHVLEDVGFNCIDNLPAGMLPALVKQIEARQQEQPTAVSIDARNTWEDLQRFPEIIQELAAAHIPCEVLFLDAREPVLIQRFSETRRKHPLSDNQTDLRQAIVTERKLLEPIADAADLTLDTSSLSLHDLRDLIKQRVVPERHNSMALLFQSFAFKRGVPVDADLVFDARCLPNPYWRQALRAYTGRDQPVIDFLQGHSEVTEFLDDITAYLQRWLPRFVANNRSYMTVAIGCTGGQHRSVYLVEQLRLAFANAYANVQIKHRELRTASRETDT